jgi:hypothetical protein
MASIVPPRSFAPRSFISRDSLTLVLSRTNMISSSPIINTIINTIMSISIYSSRVVVGTSDATVIAIMSAIMGTILVTIPPASVTTLRHYSKKKSRNFFFQNFLIFPCVIFFTDIQNAMRYIEQ